MNLYSHKEKAMEAMNANNNKFMPMLPAKSPIQTEICRKNVTAELSADYTLPDYQPEIKKLHRVTVNVIPPTQFVGSGSAEFSGTLDYSLLYSDNDGKLCLAVISDDYSFSVPFEKSADGSDPSLDPELLCFADVVSDSVNARVSAPRRVSLRCRLHAKVSAYGTDTPECIISGMSEHDVIEKLEDTVGVNCVMRGECELMMLGDEISFDSNPSAALSGGGEIRIIMPEVSVFVSEVSAADGYVSCRGDATVKILLCREDPEGEPYSVTKKLPFSTAVELDGVSAGCECRAFGRVHDISVSNEEGRILCEVGVSIVAEAQKNVGLCYVKDIYSTESDCECTVKEQSYPTALRCFSGNLTGGGTLTLAELGVEPGSVLIDCSALSASVDSVTLDKGKYAVLGNCRYSLLMNLGAETFSKECTLPFKYETDAKSDISEFEFDATAEVISVRCRTDAEKVLIDSEIFVTARLFGTNKLKAVTEAMLSAGSEKADGNQEGQERDNKKSAFTVCYPDKSDTLWSVGKRYRAELATLAERNGLRSIDDPSSTDSIKDVKYLLI